uniref:CXC domain-containing protein n=1 Tax=Macrostomum lignano TaxID=282301 RepID=A0A1I8FN53_9PLAT
VPKWRVAAVLAEYRGQKQRHLDAKRDSRIRACLTPACRDLERHRQTAMSRYNCRLFDCDPVRIPAYLPSPVVQQHRETPFGSFEVRFGSSKRPCLAGLADAALPRRPAQRPRCWAPLQQNFCRRRRSRAARTFPTWAREELLVPLIKALLNSRALEAEAEPRDSADPSEKPQQQQQPEKSEAPGSCGTASSSSSSSNGCHVPDWLFRPGVAAAFGRAEDYGKLMVRYVELEDRAVEAACSYANAQHRQAAAEPQPRRLCLATRSPKRSWTATRADMTLVPSSLPHAASCRQILPPRWPASSGPEANLSAEERTELFAAAQRSAKCAKKAGVTAVGAPPGHSCEPVALLPPLPTIPAPFANDQCSCRVAGNFCEKFCQCSSALPRKPPVAGCRCKSQCNTNAVPTAVLAVRECDPDLLLHLRAALRNTCLMAPSDVPGWANFLRDSGQRGDFIYASTAARCITQDEADRRGKQTSWWTATRKGNKIGSPITRPELLSQGAHWSTGDHRHRHLRPIGPIARLAKELFFDYRYGPMEQLKYVGIERGAPGLRPAAAAASAATCRAGPGRRFGCHAGGLELKYLPRPVRAAEQPLRFF